MIKVTEISKTYGLNQALASVSFQVEKGEIVGLVGRNGAGKSTTMNIITGYLSSDSGSVEINGFDIIRDPVKAKENLGYMPEFPPLYPDMSVEKYLRFVCELMKVPKAEIPAQLDDVIQEIGLTAVRKRLIGNLSKGYKQRVGIAKALCGSPENIILDEPTSGLDPKQIVEIRKVIRGLRKEHAVIISSHILKELADICTRFIVIDRGQVVANGTLDELVRMTSGGDVLQVAYKGDPVDTKTFLAIEGIKEAKRGPVIDGEQRYELREEPDADAREAVSRAIAEAGGIVVTMKHRERSIEDAFLELTDGSAGGPVSGSAGGSAGGKEEKA